MLPPMIPTAPLVADFAARLESAGFAYLLGGSFASSAWGQPRATNDADFSIWLEEDRVP